jgi:UDP-N-acetylglucosamine pyrophosphorylase
LPDVVKLSGLSEIDKKSLTDIGINAIVQGKVAVLLLAGGQVRLLLCE